MGPYEWMSWKEAEGVVGKWAAGYRKLGVGKGDKVTIFADTSRDWMFTAMACVHQGIVMTTAYATLGEEGLTHSLNECEVTTIFTSADLLPMIAKVSQKCKELKNVVYSGAAELKALELVKHLRVLSLTELEALGEESPVEPEQIDKEDLAMIMYTSGSSGPPKGVMLTNTNVIAAIAGGRDWIAPHLQETDVSLGFLPLAHILEFTSELNLLYSGVAIGYGNAKTLTSANMRNCQGDVQALRPTIFVGVPQVWEGIRKAVTEKITASSSIAQALFNSAYNSKLWCLRNGVPGLAAPFDKIVFSKIRDQFGGRLRYALTAGAAVPKSTQEFLNVTTVKLANGYGMTECAATAAAQDLTRTLEYGETSVATSIEMKLVDCAELGYKTSDVPRPRGEVWLRGPSVMKGYYRQEQLTRDTITEDGWLMTGDIGEINEYGGLVLIDRKKNLVKMSNGEYIALEKMEANYKVSKYVQNICVYADLQQNFAVALIQPVEKEIRAEFGADADYNELCARKDVRALVHKSLNEVGKGVGFKGAELVGSVILTPEEWTPQNGMLTAAMKLNRKVILNRYKADVAAVYA
ncbi:acetyl-CoA synthetase-like protein, partial [Rhizoclosmatium globosum]